MASSSAKKKSRLNVGSYESLSAADRNPERDQLRGKFDQENIPASPCACDRAAAKVHRIGKTPGGKRSASRIHSDRSQIPIGQAKRFGPTRRSVGTEVRDVAIHDAFGEIERPTAEIKRGAGSSR